MTAAKGGKSVIEVTTHSDLVKRYVETYTQTDMFGRNPVIIPAHFVVELPKPIGFWTALWLYLMECW